MSAKTPREVIHPRMTEYKGVSKENATIRDELEAASVELRMLKK